ELFEVFLEMINRIRIALEPAKCSPFADTKHSFKNVGHRLLQFALGQSGELCIRYSVFAAQWRDR
ncbi:MAG: hypothetical protein QOE21_920, partial [Microbacteriaceae bacterium]|nr:hypothetical protein [Microbacteriaceae bacterium]